MGILIYLRAQVTPEQIPELDFGEVSVHPDGRIDYTTIIHHPFYESRSESTQEEWDFMQEEYSFAGVIARPRLFFLPRACFWTGNYYSQKQVVALAPRNEFTLEIERQIYLWRLHYTRSKGYRLNLRVVFFENKQEILEYEPPDTMDGLCFGVVAGGNASADSFDFELLFDD